MNTFAVRKAWRLMCGLFLAAPLLAQDVVRLQVVTPPAWRLLPEQRFADLFAGSLRDALANHGYVQPLAVLGAVEDPAKVPHLLTVTITDWRIADSGNITCSFTASLRTPAGEHPLGTFADTVWAPGVVYPGSGHAYYPLSGTAIRNLGVRLAASSRPSNPVFSQTGSTHRPAESASLGARAASTL
jgi:hypothetical protein